jgi:Transposase zinc-ribbon domain
VEEHRQKRQDSRASLLRHLDFFHLGHAEISMKLIDIHKQFSTDEKRFDDLEKMRWPSGVACIECGSLKVSRITRESKTKNRQPTLAK